MERLSGLRACLRGPDRPGQGHRDGGRGRAEGPPRDVFFIGSNVNYPTMLEGALKLKEISYIHAEGFAAGELKHGPLAFLDAKTPIIAVAL